MLICAVVGEGGRGGNLALLSNKQERICNLPRGGGVAVGGTAGGEGGKDHIPQHVNAAYSTNTNLI